MNFFLYSHYFIPESWIELTNNLIQSCPDRVTPPLPFSSGEEYLRLLKEAQKESNPSSLISSRRDSPKVGSPKSPPNSPNPYYNTDEEELKGVFINYYGAKVSQREFNALECISRHLQHKYVIPNKAHNLTRFFFLHLLCFHFHHSTRKVMTKTGHGSGARGPIRCHQSEPQLLLC